jgi:DNA topoisomerase-1
MSANRRRRRQKDLYESTEAKLASAAGLRRVTIADLEIERRRHGGKFIYVGPEGRAIRNSGVITRLARLAVPPAYVRARYCSDARGHIQAIWRDAAGRRQYRYHDKWGTVRAQQRRARLADLAHALPRIRRGISRQLSRRAPTLEFALAAVLELAWASGVRAGRESYARNNGTRGAATLLKSDVTTKGDEVALCFRAKGGKIMRKTIEAPRLSIALRRLRRLAGKRLFQYRDDDGRIRAVCARQVNEFLCSLADAPVTLKDFRTLAASATVVRILAKSPPARSERRRKTQIRDAMRRASSELGNTPAICRRSYVPAELVEAFEQGKLQRATSHGRRAEALLYRLLAEKGENTPACNAS